MDLHDSYQPGFTYKINGTTTAHIYAVHPADNLIIGALEMWSFDGLREPMEAASWNINGAYGLDGVRDSKGCDLPALPCRAWGKAGNVVPVSTADEIAAKVVEQLADLRIAPVPAQTTQDTVSSYTSGRRAGRCGLLVEMRNYVNERFQKGSTDTNGDREKGALDELGRMQGFIERLTEAERQQAQADRSQPRVAAE